MFEPKTFEICYSSTFTIDPEEYKAQCEFLNEEPTEEGYDDYCKQVMDEILQFDIATSAFEVKEIK